MSGHPQTIVSLYLLYLIILRKRFKTVHFIVHLRPGSSMGELTTEARATGVRFPPRPFIFKERFLAWFLWLREKQKNQKLNCLKLGCCLRQDLLKQLEM